MFIMKLLLFFASLAIGIMLWATYDYESFYTYTYPIIFHIFTLPIFWSPEFIIDTIRIDIILHHGVLIGIELAILSFIIFKFFFRMQIRAILRLRSLAAIAFSSFILYAVIFEILHLDRTEIWGRFVFWIEAYGSLITYTSLFRFNADLYTKFLLIAAIFLVSYIFTAYQVRSHRRSILSSGTITVLSDDLIERSSIRDLVRKAKLRKRDLPEEDNICSKPQASDTTPIQLLISSSSELSSLRKKRSVLALLLSSLDTLQTRTRKSLL